MPNSIKRLFACLDDADADAAHQPAHRPSKGSKGSATSSDGTHSAKKPRSSSSSSVLTRTTTSLCRVARKLRSNPITPQRSFKGPTDHAPRFSDDTEADDPNGRWGPILSISDEALVSLVSLFTFSTQRKSATNISVIARTNGRNNALYTVQYYCPSLIKVCVRVPACGWGDRWLPSDADALRNVAHTMRYVQKHTTLPVPDVLQYDTTFNNAIGAPYLMMSYVHGRPLPEVWYDRAAGSTKSLEDKRQAILRSLATVTASLRSLTFTKMGPLLFRPVNGDDQDQRPYVAAAVMAPFGRPMKKSKGKFNPQDHLSTPENDSRAFFFHCLDAARAYAIAHERTSEVRGVFKLWRLLMEEMPWPERSSSTRITYGKSNHGEGNEDEGVETFVLGPPADFDAASILVDEHSGAVVGVVGWDGLETQPLMLGWPTCPDLLTVDWTRGISWPRRPPFAARTKEMATVDIIEDGRSWDAYRADYAAHLQAAIGAGGLQASGFPCELYARKGHLYQAVLRSLDDLDQMREVLDRVLEVTLPRVRRADLVVSVGEAGLSAEQERYVRAKFRELLR
ncbi:hypothetical protein DIS24_g5605 [Lasiodiplodia hormozganensis]|uniref:Aminoglycoside phosphotransferase domain-containing protein n=1 Tax=Lasiodiplodia hormozganensis TaxID=869390 RepID=A0AA39YLS4_9PEZI|nr:hypothetical protein DIS24_g5605 [Lasiodiplodia hormozganensis]